MSIRFSILTRRSVVVRILASHHGERRSIPGGQPPGFTHWESCRTMLKDDGFSRGSAVPLVLAFRRYSIITSFHPHRLKTSMLRAAQISSLTLIHSTKLGACAESYGNGCPQTFTRDAVIAAMPRTQHRGVNSHTGNLPRPLVNCDAINAADDHPERICISRRAHHEPHKRLVPTDSPVPSHLFTVRDDGSTLLTTVGRWKVHLVWGSLRVSRGLLGRMSSLMLPLLPIVTITLKSLPYRAPRLSDLALLCRLQAGSRKRRSNGLPTPNTMLSRNFLSQRIMTSNPTKSPRSGEARTTKAIATPSMRTDISIGKNHPHYDLTQDGLGCGRLWVRIPGKAWTRWDRVGWEGGGGLAIHEGGLFGEILAPPESISWPEVTGLFLSTPILSTQTRGPAEWRRSETPRPRNFTRTLPRFWSVVVRIEHDVLDCVEANPCANTRGIANVLNASQSTLQKVMGKLPDKYKYVAFYWQDRFYAYHYQPMQALPTPDRPACLQYCEGFQGRISQPRLLEYVPLNLRDDMWCMHYGAPPPLSPTASLNGIKGIAAGAGKRALELAKTRQWQRSDVYPWRGHRQGDTSETRGCLDLRGDYTTPAEARSRSEPDDEDARWREAKGAPRSAVVRLHDEQPSTTALRAAARWYGSNSFKTVAGCRTYLESRRLQCTRQAAAEVHLVEYPYSEHIDRDHLRIFLGSILKGGGTIRRQRKYSHRISDLEEAKINEWEKCNLPKNVLAEHPGPTRCDTLRCVGLRRAIRAVSQLSDDLSATGAV
ncbi:hypothetical protein PR048_017131 [Dryococelus australis]|uniref:Uncharacterized protein n=1 Tax=Dryococelus australis TaxID=614101 RepID=A0ABQ9H8R8_9NEOP|nr:hypothetical protein PR048_017131 [Dryococelus australis]